MPPRASLPKRSTRRIIEDEESDDAPDDDQYDDEEEDEEQQDDGEEDDEVDELEEDEEDYSYGAPAPSKTGLKIKLNVGAAKLKAGGTVVSTPGETPPFAMPRMRRANKKRAVVPSDDEDQEEQDEAEEDEDGGMTPSQPSQPARMTARQAAIAGGGGPVEHVSLEEPPNPRKRKWTEEELAMRREEAARKRKLKGAQRQEDEKQMIINRLINKGTGKRGRWASKAKDPTPEADEEAEEGGAATGAAGEGTEAGEPNESTTGGEEEPTGVATPAVAPPTRGGWRGRGRRGRGARLPPPPVRMHIPVMRWLSGMRDITIEDLEPIEVDPTDLERGKDLGVNSTTATAQAPEQPKPPAEREPFISFSIPPELIAATTIEDPIPPPKPKSAPKCAVKGCNSLRKYKLVGGADPEMGACGMAHLSTLQGVH